MAQPTVVLEGSLKYREGKKWKPRWCTIRKLSPAADRLHISLYKTARDRYHNGQEKINIPLENFYGIASEFQLDREQHVMAIVCDKENILLAFQNTETLLAWVLTVRKQLGEEHQFNIELIKAPPLSRLFHVTYSLYIQGTRICLVSGLPPRIHATWALPDIKKFGIVENKFCFEAGARCDRLSGLYALLSDQLQEIAKTFQAASIQNRSRCNSTSSRQSSQASLYGSRGTVSDLQTASLPRNIHRRDLAQRDQTYISHAARQEGSGIVRCATVSGADCKRPRDTRQYLEDVTQSTPNIKHRRSCNTHRYSEIDNIQLSDSSVPQCKQPKTESTLEERSKQCHDSDHDCLKSRRYSSGDLYLSKGNRHSQSHRRRQEVFGATAAVIQRGVTSTNTSQSQRSQSEVDVSDFYLKVQKTLDVLRPKLGRPGEWKGGAKSTDSIQTGSSSCMLDLESHGHGSQGYTSNSSLALSEILQSCSLFSSEDRLSEIAPDSRGVKSTSSGSSSTSARELVDTPTVTCSIGSLGDPLSQYGVRCRHVAHSSSQRSCRNCRRHLSRSVANLSRITSPVEPVVSHSNSWTQLNHCPSDVSLGGAANPAAMRQEGGLCMFTPGGDTSAASSRNVDQGDNSQQSTDSRVHLSLFNPLSPLKYVDLSPYDGDDDGYIHCLKRDSSRSSHSNKDNGLHHVEYQNIPIGRHKVNTSRSSPQKHTTPHCIKQNLTMSDSKSAVRNVMSIHGSLRRPQGKGILQAYFGWEKGEQDEIEDKLAGEYVRLKEATTSVLTPPRPVRKPKSGSLENILERDNPSPTGSHKYICDTDLFQNKPGSDLFAIVPTRLAAYSKEDLMDALAKSKHLTDNRLVDSLEKLAIKSESCHSLPRKVDSPHKAAFREPDYMIMAGSTASVDDNNVFCSVELPHRSCDSDSNTADYLNIPSRPRTNSGASNVSRTPSEEQGYLDMSLGRSPRKEPSPGKQSLKHASTEPAYLDMTLVNKDNPDSSINNAPIGGQNKHKLQHSKSLDDELDVPYLEMNVLGRQHSAEYLIMSHKGQNQNSNMGTPPQLHNGHGDAAIYVNRSALKPFDNLIPHKPYTEHRPKESDDTASLGSSVRVGDNISTGDKSSSEDDSSSQKSSKSNKSNKSSKKSNSPVKSSGKSSGLFSRLMKRNSVKSKEKLDKEKSNKGKEQVKLKQSRSTQDFSSSGKNQPIDRRHSVQPTYNHNVQTSAESTSRLSDLSGSLDPESLSHSSNSMTSSHRSDSPAESGLVTLSQWKIGGGLANLPPSQRPLLSKDIARVTSPRLNQSLKEEYGSCPLTSESSAPPVLPPKTYKRLSNGQLTSTTTPPLRRHSSEDRASVDQPHLELSVSSRTATYTNSSVFNSNSSRQNGKSNSIIANKVASHQDMLIDDDGPPEELPPPPPIPEKIKGSKKSLLGFAELSTMETVHEGSHSAEKDSDTGGQDGSDIDDDDVFLDNSLPRGSNRLNSMLPPGECIVRPKKNPNLRVAIPRTSGEHGGHHRGRCTETWHEGTISETRPSHARSSLGVSSEERRVCHLRTGSTRSTASSSSCDSCDTHSTYCEEHSHVSSPAITTMRPRFGKEYKRIDRKKLAEELNMPLPGHSGVSHSSEPSPSAASVFTFDCVPQSTAKSRQSSTCSAHSFGETSPKYPYAMGNSTRHSRDPAYVNLSFSRNSSPVILDSTPPPQSPGARSVMSNNSEVILNYAEIDLSDSGKGKKPVRPIPKKGGVEYAVIDMVATVTASRVGREHAQLREDKLLWKSKDTTFINSCSPTHTRGSSVTLPNPNKEKRTSLGRSNSTSSRDRKL